MYLMVFHSPQNHMLRVEWEGTLDPILSRINASMAMCVTFCEREDSYGVILKVREHLFPYLGLH